MQRVIQTPRSKLIFIVPDGTTANTINFSEIEPVRTAVTRSKRSERGMVSDVENECGLDAEGINEFWALRVIVATGHFHLCKVQPFLMLYSHDGVPKRYFPDFLLSRGKELVVVEVKIDWVANKDSEKERFALIRELLREHGFEFFVWKKSEVLRQPRYGTACLLLRYRREYVSDAERERVFSLVSSVPQISIAELRQQARVPVRSICYLILRGELHIDWWSPLTIDSSVSSVPIGDQLWPSPYASLPQTNTLGKEDEEDLSEATEPQLDQEAIRIVREVVAGIQASRDWRKSKHVRQA